MKKYEETSKNRLLSRTPVLIRVDGRAFHTFTKGSQKPYDEVIINAMVYATEMTAKEISGFELAYVQSDEATFFISDYEHYDSQGWFDYEINKIVSIAASAFTAYFNNYWYKHWTTQPVTTEHAENMRKARKIAMFDARAFNVPYDDVPNAFIWRQKDWIRNSVQMLAQSKFSHQSLQGIDNESIKDALREVGHPWEGLTDKQKYGTFVSPHGTAHVLMSYENIKSMMKKAKDE